MLFTSLSFYDFSKIHKHIFFIIFNQSKVFIYMLNGYQSQQKSILNLNSIIKIYRLNIYLTQLQRMCFDDVMQTILQYPAAFQITLNRSYIRIVLSFAFELHTQNEITNSFQILKRHPRSLKYGKQCFRFKFVSICSLFTQNDSTHSV